MKSKIVFVLISLLVFIAAFFTVKAPISENLYSFSAIFILLFALPSYYFLLKLVGLKNGLIILLAMSLFAIILEVLAIKTGIPYGKFVYGERIGFKVFDILPWTLPFAYVPLVTGTVTLAQKISTSKFSVVGISTLILLFVDFVIDPGAVSLNFWEYENGGFFYDVPLSNFIGWIGSGYIASFLFYSFVEKKELPKQLVYSLFEILVFWTGVAFWSGLIIPFLIGLGLLFIVSRSILSE